MLVRHGHDVDLVVREDFNCKGDIPSTIKPWIPKADLIDYESKKFLIKEHEEFADELAKRMCAELKDHDIIFTHDWIFTGWNYPMFLGLQKASEMGLKARGLHWIHSLPVNRKDWWNLEGLRPLHKIVFPAQCYKQLVAESYRCTWEDIKRIPHIRDMRTFMGFREDTCELIDAFPGIMQADIVQIYPASADRMTAKRVRELILIFKEFKKMGLSVCLVVANQWATQRNQKEEIDEYVQLGLNNGLDLKELVFTSEFQRPRYECGLPQEMLRELYQCSNLFIFPTREESWGLVLPEAVLAGGVLPVINHHLDVLPEVTGNRGLRFGFGSWQVDLNYEPLGGEGAYFEAVAGAVLQRMTEEESVATKTVIRMNYNMDNLYNKTYGPILQESKQW